QAAEILVAGVNFGCGSSREHAVWAVLGGGFKAVIAKSFADIFYSNSSKNGLMLVTLPEAVVDAILRDGESGDYRIEIDLATQRVVLPNGEEHIFEYDPFRKHCMLNGLDDIDYIMSHKAEIDAFRARQDAKRFFSTTTPSIG
ncbi:MAG: 3-isopropylmalate dehydratase small subunit, partial [Bdellovibrionales bacterium]|nr:3-isopropylmalate dehydratase small subunit [Bdellovibrionales bacterium]